MSCLLFSAFLLAPAHPVSACVHRSSSCVCGTRLTQSFDFLPKPSFNSLPLFALVYNASKYLECHNLYSSEPFLSAILSCASPVLLQCLEPRFRIFSASAALILDHFSSFFKANAAARFVLPLRRSWTFFTIPSHSAKLAPIQPMPQFAALWIHFSQAFFALCFFVARAFSLFRHARIPARPYFWNCQANTLNPWGHHDCTHLEPLYSSNASKTSVRIQKPILELSSLKSQPQSSQRHILQSSYPPAASLDHQTVCPVMCSYILL